MGVVQLVTWTAEHDTPCVAQNVVPSVEHIEWSGRIMLSARLREEERSGKVAGANWRLSNHRGNR